jgi:branched-chain amino acid transport system permease protein
MVSMAIIAFFIIAPHIINDYYLSLLLDLFMWISLTSSWIILSGYTGYISLAHSAFYGIGAYFMAMAWLQIPYFLAIVLGGLLAAGFAMLIGYPFLRVRGPYFVILTLGLTELTKYIFINMEIRLGGTVGRILMSTPSLTILYYSMLVVLVGAIITAFLIKQSRFGVALFSIKEDEEAAVSLGVNAAFFKWLAFGISAFFPGMVGAILALRRSYIDPYTSFDLTISFQVIVMAFLGGIAGVEGAIIGALVLTLISEYLWSNYPYFYMILTGCIMIFIVKFMPNGIVFSLRQWMSKGRLGTS